MKKCKCILVFLALLFFVSGAQSSQAQVLRVVTVNTLTGAITGTALGGATIALKNEYETYPLRFGLGLGTILGLGSGFYDMSHYSGYGYRVKGLFSTSSTTGSIIFLDTFYGATTGGIVGMAISLMGNDTNIVKGLQYGSGVGAWVGFGFGLVDAFVLSTTRSQTNFYNDYSHAGYPPAGLVELRSTNDQLAVGFFNPVLFQTLRNHGEGNIATISHFGLELTRLQFNF